MTSKIEMTGGTLTGTEGSKTMTGIGIIIPTFLQERVKIKDHRAWPQDLAVQPKQIKVYAFLLQSQ